jgi:hypothetical protein
MNSPGTTIKDQANQKSKGKMKQTSPRYGRSDVFQPYLIPAGKEHCQDKGPKSGGTTDSDL